MRRPLLLSVVLLGLARLAGATCDYQSPYVRDLCPDGFTNGCAVQRASGAFTCAELPWTSLTSYPGACGAGTFVTTLGDTPTCATAYYQTVQDEGGAALPQRTILNFAGAGVTCADDAGTRTTCTIPGTTGGAADSEPYVTVSNTAGLSAERALAFGDGGSLTDGGANGALTMNIGEGACIQTAGTDVVALKSTCNQDQLWSGKFYTQHWFAHIPDATELTCAGGVNVINDWTPPDATNVILAWSGAGCQVVITGIVAGKAGRILYLVNANTHPTETLTLTHEDAGSAAANRIWIPGNQALAVATNMIVVPPGDMVELKWEYTSETPGGLATDVNTGRWFVVSQHYAADRLWANPANCGAGGIPRGIDQQGTAEGCATIDPATEFTPGPAWSKLRTSATGAAAEWKGAWLTLASNVTCAVSASYCTIWSYTPPVASSGVNLYARILIDSDSTTVAPQFRVSSADTGYTGNCHWTCLDNATPDYDLVAIGTGPTDTADTAWGSTDPTMCEVRCALLADASPGAVVVEWQLETGTSPTQTVLKGSSLEVTQN